MRGRRHTVTTVLEMIDVCSHGITCKECCWLWSYGCDKWGYPKIKYHKESWIGHRLLFFLINERLPKPCLLHTCDKPLCMNYHHHYEGTQKQNITDMSERGRGNHLEGSAQRQSKLNEARVKQMRRLYASGGWTHLDLALLFDVGKSVVGRILLVQDWKHV